MPLNWLQSPVQLVSEPSVRMEPCAELSVSLARTNDAICSARESELPFPVACESATAAPIISPSL